MRYPERTICYEEKCQDTNHNASSEQAHAFFPLYPLIIRKFALAMYTVLPQYMLPPTFESLAVLAGLIWNIFAFTVATLELFSLTTAICLSSMDKQNSTLIGDAHGIAMKVAFAFCFNPANVFFISCYSESTFSAFIFTAYSTFERSQRCSHKIRSISFFTIATVSWFLASFCRSNGILSVLFLFIHWCGDMVRTMSTTKKSKQLRRILWKSFYFLFTILVIVYPFFQHDNDGKTKHCKQDYYISEACTAIQNKVSFYSYIQLKYWDVGFFHYYQLKQLPNFLLASPVIVYSSMAVREWILLSWNRWQINCKKKDGKWQNQKNGIIGKVLRWTFFSLREIESDETDCDQILLGRSALAHYAMLCSYILVGACISHVQIATRLIASSCPSFYWFIMNLFHQNKENASSLRKNLLILYIISFHLLGCILHVNWLPWT
jgi:phosphatidylinositol glycan class V